MGKSSEELSWNLDAPWAMGSEDYRTLYGHLDQIQPRTIVELGSGQSTFQLAADFSGTRLLSLENDISLCQDHNSRLAVLGMDSANVIYSPIKLQFRGGGLYFTYDTKNLTNFLGDESKIDCLLVDGPVEAMYPLGREASLYLLFGRLAVGAVVALDDYHRDSANEAVQNWLAVFAGSLELLEETESFAVLQKSAECERPVYTMELALRSYVMLPRTLARMLKRAMSNRLR